MLYSVQTWIFAIFGILFAVYLYSVVEHDDGVGKVCLILLGCLGVTLPFVLLNFNFDANLKVCTTIFSLEKVNNLQ